MNPTILPPGVYLLLQRHHPMDQPMGSHADTGKFLIFMIVNSVT
jgi:hypothetical protein